MVAISMSASLDCGNIKWDNLILVIINDIIIITNIIDSELVLELSNTF